MISWCYTGPARMNGNDHFRTVVGHARHPVEIGSAGLGRLSV